MLKKDFFESEMGTIRNMSNVILIHSCYKIVKKEETEVLLGILEKCDDIYKGFNSLIGECGVDIDIQDVVCLCNLNIIRYLNKLFNFYSRKFGIDFGDCDWGSDNSEFSSEWRILKTIDNNIGKICYELKSWEY